MRRTIANRGRSRRAAAALFASRLVQGNDLPASGFVVVEAYSSSEDAETVLGQYEKIKTPAVAGDTLVYSAAPPADQADVDAVADAAGS